MKESLDIIFSSSKDIKVFMLNINNYFALSGIKIHWISQQKGIWLRNDFLFCERISIHIIYL